MSPYDIGPLQLFPEAGAEVDQKTLPYNQLGVSTVLQGLYLGIDWSRSYVIIEYRIQRHETGDPNEIWYMDEGHLIVG